MNTLTNKTTTGTSEDLMSTVDVLMRAFRAHTRGRCLPAPYMLSFSPRSRQMDVMPEGSGDFARLLANVLLWAHTLSDVTATWSRTGSDNLHVVVIGRTNIGARMRVFCVGDFTDCAGLVTLDPGQHDGVSLDELFALACLLREHQQQNGRQVAAEGAGKEVAR
ncbi:hypothetical protein [Actinophytocola sp. KF-1]